MHYKGVEPNGATASCGLDPAPPGQVLPVRASGTHDVDAFWEAISLQAAARKAAFAKGSEAPQGRDQLDLEEDVSPRRSSKLVLALAIGIAVFACVTYFMMGGHLLLR